MVAYHKITIKALRAEDLNKPSSWWLSRLDPYLEIWFGGEAYATPVQENEKTVEFNHTFEMPSHQGSEEPEYKELIFRVLDKYAINCFTEPIGEARVKTNSLCRGNLTLQLKYISKDTTKEPVYAGTLHLVVESDGSPVLPELSVIATIKKTHPRNLMAKHWEEKYYYSLHPERRKRLLACCKPGYEDPESPIGIQIIKAEDEKDFAPYFNKVFTEAEERRVKEEEEAEEEHKRLEAQKAAEEEAERERTAMEEAAAAARAAEEEQRAAAERAAAEEKKAAEEASLAARRAEIEKQVAELRAAAEAKALAVKKAAEEKAAAEKRAAEAAAAAAKRAEEQAAAQAAKAEEEMTKEKIRAAKEHAERERKAAEEAAVALKAAEEKRKLDEKKAAEKAAAGSLIRIADEKKAAEKRAVELEAAQAKAEAEQRRAKQLATASAQKVIKTIEVMKTPPVTPLVQNKSMEAMVEKERMAEVKEAAKALKSVKVEAPEPAAAPKEPAAAPKEPAAAPKEANGETKEAKVETKEANGVAEEAKVETKEANGETKEANGVTKEANGKAEEAKPEVAAVVAELPAAEDLATAMEEVTLEEKGAGAADVVPAAKTSATATAPTGKKNKKKGKK